MSNLLHNMSAPPRSRVHFQQKQLNQYIAFNPLVLFREIYGKNHRFQGSIVKKYVEEHPEILNEIKKPTGYMLGETFDLVGNEKFTKELNERLRKYTYEECRDVNLLILVLCSTVGDLYIPDRPLSFEDSKFKRILFFPKEEVYS